MNTYTLQIGNTDNKLTQQEWSEYVAKIIRVVKKFSDELYFSGGSSNWEPWQNYCIVFSLITDEKLNIFMEMIVEIKDEYKQDSVALTIGSTIMLENVKDEN